MKITDAILSADRFIPNRFTLREKLNWCNELSAMLSQEICKSYDYIECNVEDGLIPSLPDGLNFEMIESVVVNGVAYTKSDLRSFDNSLIMPHGDGTRVRVVYLKKYMPIRSVELEGEYSVSGDFIGISNPPLKEGDLIKIITKFNEDGSPDTESAVYTYVFEVTADGIRISDCLEESGSVNMLISRVLTDETLAPMPYDKMYTEYLLSKYALHSGDYDGYRSFSEQFNITLRAYADWHKSRNPLCRTSRFNNYWR